MLSEQLKEAIRKEEARRPQKIVVRDGVMWLGCGVLPDAADDLTWEEGIQVYRHMDNEPVIAGIDFLIRAMTLEPGWTTATAVEEPVDKTRKREAVQARKDYELSEQVRKYIADMMERLETPFGGVLWDSCAAWPNGHKLFEQIRALMPEDDGGFSIQTVAIKPKPIGSYSFVVTRFMDALGVIPQRGAYLLEIRNGEILDSPEFVPMEDLFVVSLRGEDGDPRGKAAKLAAYDAWRRKQLAKPESLLHMQMHGTARYSVESSLPATSDGPMPALKVKVNGVEVDTLLYISGQMQTFINNGYLLLPPGFTLKDHMPNQGGGMVFEQLFDRTDREMTQALIAVTRATQEAQFGSKADSGTAEGLLAKLINWLRQVLCEQVRDQIFRPIVRLKFGEEVARRLTPKLVMQSVAKEDVAALITAVAQGYAAGVITDEQLPWWDRRIGQPEIQRGATDGSAASKAITPEIQAAVNALATATGQESAQLAKMLGYGGEPDPKAQPGQDPATDFAAMPERKKAPGQAVYRDYVRRRLAHLDDHLARYSGGEISLDKLSTLLQKDIHDAHRVAAVLGRQRAGSLYAEDDIDREHAAAAFRADADFFSGFIADLEEGRYGSGEDFKLSSVRRRARMYVHKARATANQTFAESSVGFTFDYLLGPNEEHCPDCPIRAAGSPYHVGDVPIPADGKTKCLTECTCTLKRSDGVQCFSKVYDAETSE